MSCNRFVVIGISAGERKTLTEPVDEQGQIDPGKGGLGCSPLAPWNFVGGVAMVQGTQPSNAYGAIEFPSAECAFYWIQCTEAGKAFLARYETVFVLATFACNGKSGS